MGALSKTLKQYEVIRSDNSFATIKNNRWRNFKKPRNILGIADRIRGVIYKEILGEILEENVKESHAYASERISRLFHRDCSPVDIPGNIVVVIFSITRINLEYLFDSILPIP